MRMEIMICEYWLWLLSKGRPMASNFNNNQCMIH